MTLQPQIIIYDLDQAFPFVGECSQEFQTAIESHLDDVLVTAHKAELILLFSECADQGIQLTQQIKSELPQCPPIFLMSNIVHETDRVFAYQSGVDDLCDYIISSDELMARCWHLIYDRVANVQLQSQMDAAQQMAHLALANTSDLGVNIQFLLDSHACADFNELAVRLFQSLKAYGLSCSLQIRGQFALKNMEENGMPRQMESTLLTQLQNKGEYFEFGPRCIINYEQVSLLIKNMPINDDQKYQMIKDNILSLLKGVSAKVTALDTEYALEKEMQTIVLLTQKMQFIMQDNGHASLQIMNKSLQLVEDMALQFEELMPFLSLNLHHETQIERMLANAIEVNQGIFSAALKKDENFIQLLANINQVLTQKIDGKVDMQQLHRLVS